MEINISQHRLAAMGVISPLASQSKSSTKVAGENPKLAPPSKTTTSKAELSNILENQIIKMAKADKTTTTGQIISTTKDSSSVKAAAKTIFASIANMIGKKFSDLKESFNLHTKSTPIPKDLGLQNEWYEV